MPKDLYGDRYTLTLQLNKKLLILDFESLILDFKFLNDGELFFFYLLSLNPDTKFYYFEY